MKSLAQPAEQGRDALCCAGRHRAGQRRASQRQPRRAGHCVDTQHPAPPRRTPRGLACHAVPGHVEPRTDDAEPNGATPGLACHDAPSDAERAVPEHTCPSRACRAERGRAYGPHCDAKNSRALPATTCRARSSRAKTHLSAKGRALPCHTPPAGTYRAKPRPAEPCRPRFACLTKLCHDRTSRTVQGAAMPADADLPRDAPPIPNRSRIDGRTRHRHAVTEQDMT